MESERRHAKRTTPGQLSYIEFEPEGGGMVLNASEEGLAFQAASPVRQSGPMRLCLSPNPEQRIELAAEIVWMDDARKSGGLYLKEMPASIREQIREWLTSSTGPRTQEVDFAPPGWEIYQLPPVSPVPAGKARGPEHPAKSPNISNSRTAGAESVPRLVGAPTSRLFPKASRGKTDPSLRTRWLPVAATVFLVFVLALTPILFSYGFRREIGKTLILMGEKLSGNTDIQPIGTSSIHVQNSNPNSDSAPSVGSASPKAATNENPREPDPASSTRTAGGEVISTDSHLTDRQGPQPHSADARSRRERSALARQLWSAVGAGDYSAEVALAQLYLSGDGVPRNCEQARVLLRAASKRGSVEALQELRKLGNRACR